MPRLCRNVVSLWTRVSAAVGGAFSEGIGHSSLSYRWISRLRVEQKIVSKQILAQFANERRSVRMFASPVFTAYRPDRVPCALLNGPGRGIL